MSRFAPGIAASDYQIASSDAANMRRQQNVSDIALGVGTMMQALSAAQTRSQNQANAAKQAQLLAGMVGSPAGQPTGRMSPVPEGQYGPGAPETMPWEQVIGQQMQNYHAPSIIAHLGAMFSQLGGSQPQGQLQPQAAAELLSLAGNRAFQQAQIGLEQAKASAATTTANAATLQAQTAQARANQHPMDIAQRDISSLRLERENLTKFVGQNAFLKTQWNDPQARQQMLVFKTVPADTTDAEARIQAIDKELAVKNPLLQRYYGGGVPAQGAGAGGAGGGAAGGGGLDLEARARAFLQSKGINTDSSSFTRDIQSGKYDSLLMNAQGALGGQ